MLNKEKYIDELLEFLIDRDCLAINKHTMEFKLCDEIYCASCLFGEVNHMGLEDCGRLTREWFNREYIEIPLLKKEEYDILKQWSDYMKNYNSKTDGNGLVTWTYNPAVLTYTYKHNPTNSTNQTISRSYSIDELINFYEKHLEKNKQQFK